MLSFSLGKKNDVHGTLCSYIFGFGISVALVVTIKAYTGVFRPNFYDGCAFSASPTPTCWEDDYTDFLRSFPSGHATLAFFGMTLFSKYSLRILEKNIINSSNSPKKEFLQRLMSIMCLLPILYAFFVSATRVRDDYHFPADVAAGSCIGVGVALVTFDLW